MEMELNALPFKIETPRLFKIVHVQDILIYIDEGTLHFWTITCYNISMLCVIVAASKPVLSNISFVPGKKMNE